MIQLDADEKVTLEIRDPNGVTWRLTGALIQEFIVDFEDLFVGYHSAGAAAARVAFSVDRATRISQPESEPRARWTGTGQRVRFEDTYRFDPRDFSTIFDQVFGRPPGVPRAAAPRGWREVLEDPQTLAAAEASYKRLAKQRHPDIPGGSDAAMAELNVAIVAARKVLR